MCVRCVIAKDSSQGLCSCWSLAFMAVRVHISVNWGHVNFVSNAISARSVRSYCCGFLGVWYPRRDRMRQPCLVRWRRCNWLLRSTSSTSSRMVLCTPSRSRSCVDACWRSPSAAFIAVRRRLCIWFVSVIVVRLS